MSSEFIKNNKFTEEQKKAVGLTYGNVLISASAGSGKTKVLVSRILNLLIEKKCKVKDLLVVTFTNAAADEMKARLKQELINYNLTEELDDLNNADIFNLHKFCSKIIKEYFYLVNLDSSFGVLSENEADFLLAQTVEKCIKEHVNDTAFQNLLESFNENRSDNLFKKTIYKIYKFLGSIDNKEKWLHNILNNNFSLNNNNNALNFLNEYYAKRFEILNQNLTTLNYEALSLQMETLVNIIQDMKNICTKINQNSLLENFDFIKNIPSLPALRIKVNNEDEESLKQELSKQKAEFKKLIDEFKETLNFENKEKLNQALEKNKKVLVCLLNFVEEVKQNYTKTKQRFNNLDFEDLEEYALLILNNDSIAQNIKDKYKYVFVDEYQDTSALQEKLISKITTGDNLFMVGDVKQSIYGFRQCNPQIFLNKFNKFERSLSDLNNLILLNKNFRSDSFILEFCNFIFSKIMTQETCGLNYEQTSMFTAGKNAVRPDSLNSPLVSINIFNKEKQDEEDAIALGLYDLKQDTLQEKENKLKNQCEFIALKIKELLNQEIYDEDLKDFRKIMYQDIAVLSRNRSKTLQALVDYFRQVNIPINASYKTLLFQNPSIALLINYLKLIQNARNDLPLYGVLNSFIYKLNEDELALIREQTNKTYFYEAVQEYYDKFLSVNDLSYTANQIGQKLTGFYEDLKYFKSQNKILPIKDLILEVLNRFEFEDCLQTAGDLNGIDNIKLFLEFIDSSSFSNIQDMLFFIDNFGKDKMVDKNIVESENSVTLTTIHASKGLEYKIVFLIDIGNKFSTQSLRDNFVLDSDLGFSCSYFDIENHEKTDLPTTRAIKLKKKEFELQEEMRLLYVALTRPKNMLFCVGETDLQNIKPIDNPADILNTNSYLGWLVGVLNYNQLETLKNNGNVNVSYNGFSFSYNVADNINNITSDIKELPSLDCDINALQKYLDFNEIYSQDKLRYTVTEILNADNQTEEEYNYVFTLDNKESDIDYSRIGTVYHEIMQKVLNQETDGIDIVSLVNKTLNFYKDEKDIIKHIKEQEIINAVENIKNILSVNSKLHKEVGFHLYESGLALGVGNSQDKVAVQGVVDLIIENQDDIYILDYKTSRLNSGKDFIKKYEKQLDLYAKAVSKFFKKPVTKKIIYSFYLNTLFFV